jgi:type I restriction enzyme, S subunit
MKNWKDVKLGDYIKIKHGFAFEGDYFSENGKHLILSPGNIKLEGGMKLTGKEKSYNGDYPEDFIFKKDDLVVVMTDLIQDAPILGGAFLISEGDKFLHNQRLGLVILKEGIDKRFLYYIFNSETYRGQVRASASGSTVKHTAPERIYDCKLKLPPLSMQHQIAGILGKYDDLIANYAQQIQLLEQTAKELYREWFVRGRCPLGSEGEVQELQKKKLRDFVKMNFGQSPPSEFYNDLGEGLPFHQGVGSYGSRYPNHDTFCSVEGKTANIGDILFSVRAPVGRLNIADKKIIIGRGLAAFSHKSDCNSFLYYFLQETFSNNEIGNGSIFNAVSKEELERYEVYYPTDDAVLAFDKITKTIDEQIENLQRQSATLRTTRDKLLPRLLRGDLLASA